MGNMEVNKSKTGNFSVINLTGRLDTSNYGELEKKLIEMIDSGEKEIIVNCSGLIYISSSGLRVMLVALKKITSVGGKFFLLWSAGQYKGDFRNCRIYLNLQHF